MELCRYLYNIIATSAVGDSYTRTFWFCDYTKYVNVYVKCNGMCLVNTNNIMYNCAMWCLFSR